MRETVRVSNKKSPGKGRCFLSSGFFAPFLGAVKRTMKNQMMLKYLGSKTMRII